MNQSLAESQMEMARFLRDPQGQHAPEGIEARRLQVYRDLVYRNIEGFISSAFPVLRSLYSDNAWEGRVRGFIHSHRCTTPLFLRISEEFIDYLVSLPAEDLQPFETELAHYEWLELAVDVAEGDPAPESTVAAPESARAELAATARLGSYHFPVHRIGPDYQPTEHGEPAHLLVYRNRKSEVCFMELNAATGRLVTEVAAADTSVAAVFQRLAREWGMEAGTFTAFAWEQLVELNRLGALRIDSA